MLPTHFQPLYFYFGPGYSLQPCGFQICMPINCPTFSNQVLQQASTPRLHTEHSIFPASLKNEEKKDSNQQEDPKQVKALQRQDKQLASTQKIKEEKCQEYIPYHSGKKQKKKALQNSKRNIVPNIIHQIFCFIQKRKKSGFLVQKYLNKYLSEKDGQISVQRFYNYQKLIKEKTNHYINQRGLKQLNTFQEPACAIFSHEEQQIYTKLNRIIARYFLKNEIEQVILTSVRMKQETRIWHLELKRKVLEDFVSLIK